MLFLILIAKQGFTPLICGSPDIMIICNPFTYTVHLLYLHFSVLHGSSCKDLKHRYPELKSGTYTITVGGESFEVVCDMETDEGNGTQFILRKAT